MSAIAFDTLKFARKLKAAGVPEEQAEAQAEVLGEAFLYNLDEIVTRDYLDAKLSGVYSRMDSIEGRLDALEGRMDSLDARMDSLEARMFKIEGHFRVMYWMLGLVIVVNVIPVLSKLLN